MNEEKTADKARIVHNNELRRDAENGDERAQYTLSEVLFKDGNVTEALEWLTKAVEKNLPEAFFTIATFQMAGVSVPYDAIGARTNLSKAANQGHADAQLVLSQLVRSGYGGGKDTKIANDLLLDLAKRDHPIALCGIAMLLHIRNALGDTVEQLLDQAALKGSHVAAYVLASNKREAARSGDASARDDRIRNLYLSANTGNPLAAAELVEYDKSLIAEIINADSFSPSFESNFDFEHIEDVIAGDVEHNFNRPDIISHDNNILIYSKFLTPAECAYIKAAAAPTIQPSSTIHPLTGEFIKNEIRTSSSCNFDPVSRDCVIYAIEERIAAVTGTDVAQGEPLNVLYYRVGEEYKFHYDHLPEDSKEEVTFLKESGQRKFTFLISMNDTYLGGETFFPDLSVTYRGQLGDALMFQNLYDDGKVNKLMRHAGMPLKKGCKWVASKWIREKRFSFGTPSHMPS